MSTRRGSAARDSAPNRKRSAKLHPAMRVLVIWKRSPTQNTRQYKTNSQMGCLAARLNFTDLQLYHAFEGGVSRLIRWGFGSKINGYFLARRKQLADASRSKICTHMRRKVRPSWAAR